MSQILTQQKTIEIGNKIQEDILDYLKYIKENGKDGLFLINQFKNDDKLHMQTQRTIARIENLLEDLICFCGGCAGFQIDCRDLYDTYSFLFMMYDPKGKLELYEAICYGSEDFKAKIYKIYYKVSDKTLQVKQRKAEENEPQS